MQRGYVYATRIVLPQFLSVALDVEPFHTEALTSSVIRPCVVLSSSTNHRDSTCEVALFATYENSPQDQITSAAAQFFSVPIESSPIGLQTRPPWPLQNQYIIACIGKVRKSEIFSWNANYMYKFDDIELQKLEQISLSRCQMWRHNFRAAKGAVVSPQPVWHVRLLLYI